MVKAYEQNPRIDFLFVTVGKKIPTKQVSFKLIGTDASYDEKASEIIGNIYTKNPDSKSIAEFRDYFRPLCSEFFQNLGKILKPVLIEVVLSISMSKNRFWEADVDNIAKLVLDEMKGMAYEDDSQVSSLIVTKYIRTEEPINGMIIGITKLTEERKGFISDIWLFRKMK